MRESVLLLYLKRESSLSTEQLSGEMKLLRSVVLWSVWERHREGFAPPHGNAQVQRTVFAHVVNKSIKDNRGRIQPT